MAPAVVTLVCIALVVTGGMMLSHGILTSADMTAQSVDAVSAIEGDIARTGLAVLSADAPSWSDYCRFTVQNTGQTKLAAFDKWDVIVSYVGTDNRTYSAWLPSAALKPAGNQWQEARIGLDGPVDFFEPGILNPSEEMVILASLEPPPAPGTGGLVSVSTPNGIESSLVFTVALPPVFTPRCRDVSLNATRYYELVQNAPDTGTGAFFSANVTGGSGRAALTNGSRTAGFLYPLLGIGQIPAGNWTAYYGARSASGARFSLDITVRRADGSVREVIAADVAAADISATDDWTTAAGTYSFPGYTVVNENDYLEIDYYAQSTGADGGVELRLDDSALPLADRTRIES